MSIRRSGRNTKKELQQLTERGEESANSRRRKQKNKRRTEKQKEKESMIEKNLDERSLP